MYQHFSLIQDNFIGHVKMTPQETEYTNEHTFHLREKTVTL